MELPELPPGSPLDPGWTEGYGHRPSGPLRRGLGTQRVIAAHHGNQDILEENAVAQVLRDERIDLWRRLWQEAKGKDDTIRELRAEIQQLRAELGGNQ